MKMTAAATASGHQLRGGVYPSIAARVIEWLCKTWSFLVLRNKSNVFAEPAASTGTVTMYRLSPLASPGVLRSTKMFCARFDSSTTVPRPDRLHQLVLQTTVSLFCSKTRGSRRPVCGFTRNVREMIVLLRNEAARYSIAIRFDLAEDLPRVMADRVQLQQVFMNLMLNGIDAMKDVLNARELTIRSQLMKDTQLMISVSDTGIGLPHEQPEQIFTAFFTTKTQGTGMGLPISRSIIESHGGRLWATSNSERGASFHFSMPNDIGSRRTPAQDNIRPLSA
jgi:glutaredoxin-related protein